MVMEKRTRRTSRRMTCSTTAAAAVGMIFLCCLTCSCYSTVTTTDAYSPFSFDWQQQKLGWCKEEERERVGRERNKFPTLFYWRRRRLRPRQLMWLRGGTSKEPPSLYLPVEKKRENNNSTDAACSGEKQHKKSIDDVHPLHTLPEATGQPKDIVTTQKDVASVPFGTSSVIPPIVVPTLTYTTVKALYFFYYGSLGAVMPYLPMYYHSLGMHNKRIGYLGAISPAITFLVSPLWALWTDKTGKLKQILLFTFVSSAVFRSMLIAKDSFAWIASILSLTAIVSAPVRSLIDSAVLNLLPKQLEFGKQRLWGQLGFGIGPLLVGPWLTKSKLGYKAAFVAYAIFSVPVLLIMLRFRITQDGIKEDKGKTTGEFKPTPLGTGLQMLFINRRYRLFFAMVFAIGLSSGVIENFAYQRLRDLGAGGEVMGVSRLISSFAGIPMFWYSGNLVKQLPILVILVLTLVSYVMRFLIYAFIRNPWLGLPAEALRGVTYAFFWSASISYAYSIAPPGLGTTTLAILNGVYNGVGQSIGSLIGGSLCTYFGIPKAFYLYAVFDSLIIGAMILHMFRRSLHQYPHQTWMN